MHEFAYGITSENEHFGDVVNPLDPERIAGGSSGGSAAALAAGLCDAALGTDSGGSIRIPAACCGIVGFKPTYGLVPMEGSFPLAPSFDHAGPMARDVAACAAILTALAPGFEPRALDSLEEVSVVVIWLDEARPLVRERVVQASRRFPRRRKGVLPFAADSYALFRHEVAAVHGELFAEHRERYGRDVRTKIERCLAVSDEEAAVAAAARERYRDRCLEALGNADLLLSPTLASVAPPTGIGDLALRDELIRFTYPFNAVGWPALALPCGPAEEGLPASLQLVGRPGADALVLAAGAALAAALA